MKSPFNYALITGATSGIGESLSYLLADKGINLILTGRNEEQLQHLSQALSPKVHVITIAADLLNPEERQKVIEALKKYTPELVINNAGFGLYGPAVNHSTAAQLDILSINSLVPLELSLEASKALIASKKKGLIVNVASAAAFLVYPTLAVYSSAKTFLVQASKALDLELAPEGIRMLVSCPGMVFTHFSERASKGKVSSPNGFKMTPEYAANQIWQQIQTKQQCRIFDWKYRWAIHLSRLLPYRWTAKLLQQQIADRF
ncbi:MAG: SDR family NAD(P)-dependent oxidoreductase [Parachlamydiaceae bacterium]|nr:SDR family NAD(P)-dependent oxidoreductase [Parachlamydiaceae bacterium]